MNLSQWIKLRIISQSTTCIWNLHGTYVILMIHIWMQESPTTCCAVKVDTEVLVPYPHKFADQTTNDSSSSVFQTSKQVQRSCPYFKIHLTVGSQNHHLAQLQVINCNVMITKRQVTRWEANRIPQMPSKWGIYSKSYLGMDSSTWQCLSLCKDVSKNEIPGYLAGLVHRACNSFFFF